MIDNIDLVKTMFNAWKTDVNLTVDTDGIMHGFNNKSFLEFIEDCGFTTDEALELCNALTKNWVAIT